MRQQQAVARLLHVDANMWSSIPNNREQKSWHGQRPTRSTSKSERKLEASCRPPKKLFIARGLKSVKRTNWREVASSGHFFFPLRLPVSPSSSPPSLFSSLLRSLSLSLSLSPLFLASALWLALPPLPSFLPSFLLLRACPLLSPLSLSFPLALAASDSSGLSLAARPTDTDRRQRMLCCAVLTG